MARIRREDSFNAWAANGHFTDWRLGPLLVRRTLHEGRRALLWAWRGKRMGYLRKPRGPNRDFGGGV